MTAPQNVMFLLVSFLILLSLCKGQCEIESGESVIIMDILESRGNQINQTTVPPELPIRGTPPQVELNIQTMTADYFAIDGKKLRLKRPIGRDINVPVVVRIGDINYNPPIPKQSSNETTVSEDVNDIAPVFISVPLPIHLQDTVPIGTVVTTVVAADADGTAPGFQIRYEINGKEISPKYFHVDAVTGQILVKGNLRNEPDSEYRIEVTARDLRTPSLYATATLTVYVDHRQ